MRSLKFRLLSLISAAVLSSASLPAFANPLGGRVVAGSATISGETTSSVTVNQSSEKGIIDWNTFNLGTGDTTRFVQPDASAVTLNRVTGGMGASTINGMINANGGVYVVNPDGMLFGPNAVINTNSFLGTTSNIANSDFMAGNLDFGIPGNPSASIVNEGRITAANGGFVALVAPGVRNDGIITANLGTVGLSSGNTFTLDLYGDNLINLQPGDSVAGEVRDVATGQTLKSLVQNTGTLRANGGRVALTAVAARQVLDSVINTSGVVEANTVGTHKGQVIFGAATGSSKPAGAPRQAVSVSGRVSAAGRRRGTAGGKIQITGEDIQLASATLDASGDIGGGTILVGGDFKGGDPSAPAVRQFGQSFESTGVADASTVSVDTASTIDVSAGTSGNGGKAVIWSNDQTTFLGDLIATGGAQEGDGGFAEISSGDQLIAGGQSAINGGVGGDPGMVLFDPAIAFILSALPGCVFDNPYDCPSDESYILASELSDGGSVEGSSQVNVFAPISSAGEIDLYGGVIDIEDPISAPTLSLSGSKINLDALIDGTDLAWTQTAAFTLSDADPKVDFGGSWAISGTADLVAGGVLPASVTADDINLGLSTVGNLTLHAYDTIDFASGALNVAPDASFQAKADGSMSLSDVSAVNLGVGATASFDSDGDLSNVHIGALGPGSSLSLVAGYNVLPSIGMDNDVTLSGVDVVGGVIDSSADVSLYDTGVSNGLIIDESLERIGRLRAVSDGPINFSGNQPLDLEAGAYWDFNGASTSFAGVPQVNLGKAAFWGIYGGGVADLSIGAMAANSEIYIPDAGANISDLGTVPATRDPTSLVLIDANTLTLDRELDLPQLNAFVNVLDFSNEAAMTEPDNDNWILDSITSPVFEQGGTLVIGDGATFSLSSGASMDAGAIAQVNLGADASASFDAAGDFSNLAIGQLGDNSRLSVSANGFSGTNDWSLAGVKAIGAPIDSTASVTLDSGFALRGASADPHVGVLIDSTLEQIPHLTVSTNGSLNFAGGDPLRVPDDAFWFFSSSVASYGGLGQLDVGNSASLLISAPGDFNNLTIGALASHSLIQIEADGAISDISTAEAPRSPLSAVILDGQASISIDRPLSLPSLLASTFDSLSVSAPIVGNSISLESSGQTTISADITPADPSAPSNILIDGGALVVATGVQVGAISPTLQTDNSVSLESNFNPSDTGTLDVQAGSTVLAGNLYLSGNTGQIDGDLRFYNLDANFDWLTPTGALTMLPVDAEETIDGEQARLTETLSMEGDTSLEVGQISYPDSGFPQESDFEGGNVTFEKPLAVNGVTSITADDAVRFDGDVTLGKPSTWLDAQISGIADEAYPLFVAVAPLITGAGITIDGTLLTSDTKSGTVALAELAKIDGVDGADIYGNKAVASGLLAALSLLQVGDNPAAIGILSVDQLRLQGISIGYNSGDSAGGSTGNVSGSAAPSDPAGDRAMSTYELLTFMDSGAQFADDPEAVVPGGLPIGSGNYGETGAIGDRSEISYRPSEAVGETVSTVQQAAEIASDVAHNKRLSTGLLYIDAFTVGGGFFSALSEGDYAKATGITFQLAVDTLGDALTTETVAAACATEAGCAAAPLLLAAGVQATKLASNQAYSDGERLEVLVARDLRLVEKIVVILGTDHSLEDGDMDTSGGSGIISAPH